jgi:DHA3 family multidrug efflux protein-like MFS transporter
MEPAAEPTARLDFGDPMVRIFAQLLVNVLLVSFINFTVWFGITFFVYLQTRSVFATRMIAGLFLVAMAGTGCGSAASSITTARRASCRYPR